MASSSNGRPNPDPNPQGGGQGQQNPQDIDPAFLAQVNAKRATYQAAAAADQLKIREQRAENGNGSVASYIEEHQEFVAAQSSQQPPPNPS
mmetsp:Transcript_9850/g.19646  ORF Transcript_9850/g.19646 Transcript_9850/m.19646 type:complete len:91 (-) Transcript_9850:35-307(-)